MSTSRRLAANDQSVARLRRWRGWRPGILRRYFAHVGIYGSGVGVLSWFLGYYEKLTAFFAEHSKLSGLALFVHAVLFWIAEMAQYERAQLYRLKIKVLEQDDA
ncbi:hypothetical protein [Sinorhizobium meliloti]|uniref:hypothetical protein n=1 Tax=Rhizobium meliloti TaxID=382 RepID=UPI003F17EE5D